MRYKIELLSLTDKKKNQVCKALKGLNLNVWVEYDVRDIYEIYEIVDSRIEREPIEEIRYLINKEEGLCVWTGVRNGKFISGVARCRENEDFNENFGYALAAARALGLKYIEEELINALELKLKRIQK